MHNVWRTLLLGCVLWSVSIHAELARRVVWQGEFEKRQEVGVNVVSLPASSPLAESGVRAGDVLLRIKQYALITPQHWSDARESLVAGERTEITFRQNGKIKKVEAVFTPLPREQFADIAVEYDEIVSDFGIAQRTIITKPTSAAGRLPGVFVVQGLSCSSIEIIPGSRSNFIRTLRALVTQSGQLVMRVEKPGKGDSQGNCSTTDFATELNGYETALSAFLARDDIDRDRVIVYGSSMGSALAPYLAEKYQLNGIISDGTYYRTWFEHMLEIERRIKTMQGESQQAVNAMINQVYIPFYYGMLVEKRSYRDLVTENPLLATYNYHGPDHMYGRPMIFYHQLQDFNVAGAWEALSSPARIRWGTYDWIMSEYDIDMIADVLAEKGHQNYEVVKFPEMDHWYTIHTSPGASFRGEPGQWDPAISKQVVNWARELNQRPWRH